MKMAMFDTHRYDRESFEQANRAFGHSLSFFEGRLTAKTASLAQGHDAVCAFVNDVLDAPTLRILKTAGVRLIALRSAGFNHVDLEAAARLDLAVTRVPEYSPHAVAEHALALALSLNRKTHRAYARVREFNFSIEGLVGFDFCGKTVGILGTGRIGTASARIFHGLGCHVLAWDAAPNTQLFDEGILEYRPLDEVVTRADVLSVHLPLTPETRHLLDARAFSLMKRGAMLINTSRGGLVDSEALLEALKSGQLGAAGLDVYEAEAGIFFSDLSGQVLQDEVLSRLISLPSVIVTSHQAFLTREALENIATSTLASARAFEQGEPLRDAVTAVQSARSPVRV